MSTNKNQLSSKHTNLLKLIFLAVLTFLITLMALYIQISFNKDVVVVNIDSDSKLNKTAAISELKNSIKNSEPVTESQKNKALEILRKSIINTK